MPFIELTRAEQLSELGLLSGCKVTYPRKINIKSIGGHARESSRGLRFCAGCPSEQLILCESTIG